MGEKHPGGKAPYGTHKKIVDDHLVTFSWLNLMKVKNHLQKCVVPKTNASSLTDLETEIEFTMAGMSSLTATEMEQEPSSIIFFLSSSNSTTPNMTTATSNSAFKGSTNENSTAEEQIVDKGLGGHPKGTTTSFSVELNQKIMLIKEEAEAQNIQFRADAKRRNKQAEKGALTFIIKQVRAKYSVCPSTSTSCTTRTTESNQRCCQNPH